jgi:hypothetical protein
VAVLGPWVLDGIGKNSVCTFYEVIFLGHYQLLKIRLLETGFFSVFQPNP